ncbi:MAG: hypothetical protein C0506_01055 [Anaerolinea sp.]|nr:hypothetical protein [Anaerolinea sp.]
MGFTGDTLSGDLGENQPSVSQAVFAVRLAGLSVVLGGVTLSVVAWATGDLGWLIAYVSYSVVSFSVMGFLTTIPRGKQKRLDREWARRFHELAIRDELTGLYNRRHFNAQLAQLIGVCQATHRPLTVALIDMDGLKSINDTQGHQAGDAALKAVASCITRAVGSETVTARTGGDEFAVIFPGVPPFEAANQVAAFQSLLDNEPLPFDGAHGPVPRLSAAVGLASVDESSEAGSLLRQADTALYANKRALARLGDRRQAS